MITALHLINLEIPFSDAFSNATSALSTREVILVGMTDGVTTGWGEAAPYPGLSTETATEVWDRFMGNRQHLQDPSVVLPPTASAALDEARADLAAKTAGQPLWMHIGGSERPHVSTVAIGLQEHPDATVQATVTAAEAGFHSIKLKIAPGRDEHEVRAVRDAMPDLTVSVDANGSYGIDDPFFDIADELGLAYIEQPLGAMHLTDHEILAERLETLICLDESLHTRGGARRAIKNRAGDILTLKPGMLGLSLCAELATEAHEAGIELKASGLIETSIGRSHTLALASLPGFVHVDFAPARWFFDADVIDTGWPDPVGRVSPHPGTGIGIPVAQSAYEATIKRSVVIEID